MTETTTPEAPVTEAPVETPVEPIEQQPEEAVTTTTEPTPTDPPTEGPAPADNPEEDDLSDYWSKKGIDISTPEGQAKAAKSYREAEQAMHRKNQEASELSKQLTDQPVHVDSDDPLVQQLANKVVTLERSQNVAKFVDNVKLTSAQEQVMSEYLTQNPQKVQMVNAGLMSLEDVYTLSGAGKEDPTSLKQAGRAEAIQELADKQRATAASGSASAGSTSTSVTAENFDVWYANLSPEERAKPETQKVLSRFLS